MPAGFPSSRESDLPNAPTAKPRVSLPSMDRIFSASYLSPQSIIPALSGSVLLRFIRSPSFFSSRKAIHIFLHISSPNSPIHLSMIHSGIEYLMLIVPIPSPLSYSDAISSQRSATFLKTPFTKPESPEKPLFFASLTLSSTAAESGTESI